MPSAHRYTKSTPERSRSANACCSAFHVSVSLVIVEADSPLALPRNCPRAGTKSPDESPCRYSSGSTSPIFGVLRAHGGKIDEQNRCRSPVSGATRLAFAAVLQTVTAPARATRGRHPVSGSTLFPFTRGGGGSPARPVLPTVRASWQPLRPASR